MAFTQEQLTKLTELIEKALTSSPLDDEVNTSSTVRLKQPTPEQIKKIRNHVGLTQLTCAHLTHVTKATWQNWESGRTTIPLIMWEGFLHKVKIRRMPVLLTAEPTPDMEDSHETD